MYQKIVIVGYVGGDAEIKFTASGAQVATFSVATSEKWTDKTTGEKKERTTWFKVSAWGRLCELAENYVRKGDKILVEGTVHASAFLTREGNPAASLWLRANQFKFLGSSEQRSYSDQSDDLLDGEEIPF